MLFCDTSTLAKYYVTELDSAAVQARLNEEDQVAFSELARAELMGVFHRRLRERKWTKDEFLAIVRQFSKDDIGGYWTWLPLDGVIVEQSVKTFTTLPVLDVIPDSLPSPLWDFPIYANHLSNTGVVEPHFGARASENVGYRIEVSAVP